MAVTGTNGKTTCAQLYRQLINKLFERDNVLGKCGYIGTLGARLSCDEEDNDHSNSDLNLLHLMLLFTEIFISIFIFEL